MVLTSRHPISLIGLDSCRGFHTISANKKSPLIPTILAYLKQVPPKRPTVVEVFQIIDRVSVMHVGGLIAHFDFRHKAGQEVLHPQDIFLLLGIDQVLAPGFQGQGSLGGQLHLCGLALGFQLLQSQSSRTRSPSRSRNRSPADKAPKVSARSSKLRMALSFSARLFLISSISRSSVDSVAQQPAGFTEQVREEIHRSARGSSTRPGWFRLPGGR